ncbi:MAG: peroxide stress protein YaaA [Candidatus Omnitrophica bacterium]|nr:peroxide stress protein YaaA [Candidatus Omnitrophota bacterium]
MGILYLIPCSNHKRRDNITSEYQIKHSILNYLDIDEKDYLKNSRNKIFKLIKEDERLIKRPSNKYLKEGPDLGGKEKCDYTPAMRRYKGRIFEKIKEEIWKDRKHEVLIMSGLYGFVLPEELIQNYNVDLVDSRIKKEWECILTFVVENFCKTKRIDMIVNLLAVETYIELINWKYLEGNGFSIYHVFGEENLIGDGLLQSIGDFLKNFGLTKDESDIREVICNQKEYRGTYETLHFTSYIDKLPISIENSYECENWKKFRSIRRSQNLQIDRGELESLIERILPKSKLPVEDKIKTPTKSHHRPSGIENFMRRLAECPYVEKVEWYGCSSGGDTSRITRIRENYIIVRFADSDNYCGELRISPSVDTPTKLQLLFFAIAVYRHMRGEIRGGLPERDFDDLLF